MSTIEYHIPNISCGHCVHTIQMEVGDLEGVSSVVADEKNKTAVIVYDAPATEEKIKTLLAEINYQVAE